MTIFITCHLISHLKATTAEWLTVIRIADATLDVLPTDEKRVLSGLMIPQFQEVRYYESSRIKSDYSASTSAFGL